MKSRWTSRFGSRRAMPPRAAPAGANSLPVELLKRIDLDPLFQVMTSDQQQWLDPYTGKSIPAGHGRVQAAREYMLGTNVWREQDTLPLERLEYERWRLDLIRLLPLEPRLRLFGKDGTWLNPYTGEFVPSVTREDGKITVRTVSLMADALVAANASASGRMLEAQYLVNQAKASSGRANTTAYFHKQAPTFDEAMEKAKSVQQHMLSDLPHLERFQFAAHYSPHHGVSGDFYEVMSLPDGRILLVVGDVSGHGVQAALVVATALKTLRFVARQNSDLIGLLTAFNDEIKTDLLPGQFITLFAGALDPDTGTLACVRAGHHPALVVNLHGDVVLRKIGKTGMAIGIATGSAFASTLTQEVVDLTPGHVFIQYTDGLTEAMNPAEDEYGEARLYASLFAHLRDLPQDLVDGIAREVAHHAEGSVGDDLTILAVVATAIAPSATPAKSDEPGSGTRDLASVEVFPDA
ncbi:MAG: serine/threonine-protein phosphatase [Planctomycetes bacterium]|nr:serine/threonine-protein phosphatase [Planctomycetota bacterium]